MDVPREIVPEAQLAKVVVAPGPGLPALVDHDAVPAVRTAADVTDADVLGWNGPMTKVRNEQRFPSFCSLNHGVNFTQHYLLPTKQN